MKKVCIKTKSTSDSRSLKGQDTKPTNVKWSLRYLVDRLIHLLKNWGLISCDTNGFIGKYLFAFF